MITGCGSSHHLAISASFAWSEILERPDTRIADLLQTSLAAQLQPLGITHMDLPMTPQKVWHAIKTATAATASV